ncbi:hypothetical protein [Pseudogemmobacter bohemicus]|uniref:hypothetical protein n=1 Tax=Pseudogemmobacter bohemicus TaxID=2250708 RepID=UPI000DD3AFA4|nr:hypothetical protein [Pseudogemmobacter bohemicus]
MTISALTVEQLVVWLDGAYPSGESPALIKAHLEKTFRQVSTKDDWREFERNLDQAIMQHAMKCHVREIALRGRET